MQAVCTKQKITHRLYNKEQCLEWSAPNVQYSDLDV